MKPNPGLSKVSKGAEVAFFAFTYSGLLRAFRGFIDMFPKLERSTNLQTWPKSRAPLIFHDYQWSVTT